jgi:hypothetical protein
MILMLWLAVDVIRCLEIAEVWKHEENLDSTRAIHIEVDSIGCLNRYKNGGQNSNLKLIYEISVCNLTG